MPEAREGRGPSTRSGRWLAAMTKRRTLSTQPAGLRVARTEIEGEAEEPPSPLHQRTPRARRAPRPGAAAARPAPAPAARLLELQEPVVAPAIGLAPARVRRLPALRQVEVVVLYSLALGLERGRPEDRVADEETAQVATHIAAALDGNVRAVHAVPVWDDLPAALREFDPQRHVVFNLVESLGGRAFTEPEAPRLLEALGFVHTGAPHAALQRCANKLVTKELLRTAGLPTPRAQIFRQPGPRPLRVPLPALVKPVAEGGSFGVTQDSLATDRDGLLERVARCLEVYRQPALAEEFIAGREINVALWGNERPKVLPISEILFQWTDNPLQQFVTFDSKWVPDSVEYDGTPAVCPAPLSPAERARVAAVATRAYRTLGMRGFARVDMRLRDGIPYVLEVNANPDLAPDAGFFRSASAAGYSYSGMLLHILRLALAASRTP